METEGVEEGSSSRRPQSSSRIPEKQPSSFLVGRIVEKGFSSTSKSGAAVSFPPPKALPFPVARHRSHGPHWSPKAPTTEEDKDGELDDMDVVDRVFASSLARPMKKKEKKGLNLSCWKELLDGNQNREPAARPKPEESRINVVELSENVEFRLKEGPDRILSPSVNTSVCLVEREGREMGKMELKSVVQPDAIGTFKDEFSMKEDINRENLIRLSQMTPQEIADAQAEIMEKMSPKILKMLKKRGQEESQSKRDLPSEEKKSPKLNNDNLLKRTRGSKSEPSGIKEKSESSAGSTERVSSDVHDSGAWKLWCERVEKVRDIRFALDGNVINVNSPMEIENGLSQYKPENVAERDFLRTEGDPAAAGYTLKEAVALCRSIIPSQRCYALQLLGSVLSNCMHHLQCKGDSIRTANNARFDRTADWQAIWAYALGPDLEIALTLRISLDDNHNSVILASTKVLQTLLSFDANELFFKLSEKLCLYEKEIYTAPIFRSRPDINTGYLHSGFWKYSAKPSNILPFDDKREDVDEEDGRTIQDDVVVAGQDIAGGLVRMGLLQRICYLFDVDPHPNLEECLLSVLTALARHSLSCASAIINCPKLVEKITSRLTMHRSVDIYPSTIKAIALLRVLSQADRQYCIEFVKGGFFQNVMRDMYRGPIFLDQWIESGKERCNLISSLMVEQLCLWKICIQYGLCISFFEDFFPAMSVWLNLPKLDKLSKADVLEDFALVAREAYHVLKCLSHRLPGLYSEAQLKGEVSNTSDDVEYWSWSLAVPMVDLASKWLSLRDSFIMPFVMKDERDSSASCIIWVVSAAAHMLASVFDKVNTEDVAVLPWLPFFIPKVGLEIVKNGIFQFSLPKDKQEDNDMDENISFIRVLSKLRVHHALDMSLSSVSCLHGLVRLVNSTDKCIKSAKFLSRISQTPREGNSGITDEQILEDGIAKWAQADVAEVFSLFVDVLSMEWQSSQKIEVFSRGGPAPGVGLGWGSSGGGYWSMQHILMEADAHLVISFLNIFTMGDLSSPVVLDGIGLSVQRINALLRICSILGPRDRHLLEEALDLFLQPSFLNFLDSCINDFIPAYRGAKSLHQRYCSEDYNFFCNVLRSHYKSFWLGLKSKSEKSKGDYLETIQEDMETSDACSLQVAFAHQRLPLTIHWFLSSLSCINPSGSTIKSSPADHNLDVAKGGIFLLLGLEAISYPKSSSKCRSPVLAVPLVWKFHALSAVLLVRTERTDVLEDDVSRDNFEHLQEFYGQELDLLRHHGNGSAEILMFRSEIHENYDSFIENLIEQFSAVSYGNELYGRQIALYMHRSVEAPVRLVAWNLLSNIRVLELLPPMERCVGSTEGYLEPIEDNEEILEAYAKTMVCGTLDRASARSSITYVLAIHHLSGFIFKISSDKVPFRNKLVKILLRGLSRRPQLKKVLLDLIKHEVESDFEKRFDILLQACEGHSSLLSEIAQLKVQQ